MKVTNPIWATFGNNSISEKENCGLKYTIYTGKCVTSSVSMDILGYTEVINFMIETIR